MGLREAALIPDLNLFAHAHVSKERGRKRLAELERKGKIKPTTTPTGRKLLSFRDAEALVEAL
jgi:hypothetical protein